MNKSFDISTGNKLVAILILLLSAAIVLCSGCSTNSSSDNSSNISKFSNANHIVDSDTSSNEDSSVIKSDLEDGVDAVPYDSSKSAGDLNSPSKDNSASNNPQANGELIVRFLNVGQGDAALISNNGEHLLIDGGPAKEGNKIFSVLRDLGITRLKAIIATHPDADHSGGLASALRVAKPDTFYCSTRTHDTKTWNNVVSALGGQEIVIPRVGESFNVGSAKVTFLGPVGKADDSNNGSLVCRVSFGSRSFLFTGDAESESESAIVSSGAALQSDVLKVGHHGSKSSTSQRFLSQVAPAFAVISVGNNSYGHPTPEVLNRLTAQNAQVLRTDQLGHIIFKTNGTDLTYTTSQKVEY